MNWGWGVKGGFIRPEPLLLNKSTRWNLNQVEGGVHLTCSKKKSIAVLVIHLKFILNGLCCKLRCYISWTAHVQGFPVVCLPGWLQGLNLCSAGMWLRAGAGAGSVWCPTSALPSAASPALGTAASASACDLYQHPSRKSSPTASELPRMPGVKIHFPLAWMSPVNHFIWGLVMPCFSHIKNMVGLSCLLYMQTGKIHLEVPW